MRQVKSDDARRTFRELLNAVRYHGEHVEILRYKTPEAVIVPKDWYERAEELEAMVIEAIECGGFSVGTMATLTQRYQEQAEALRKARRQTREEQQ